MNILQLINSKGFYGAENVILHLATELKTSGHRVTVGVFDDARGPNFELLERVRAAGLGSRIFPCGGRWDWKTARLLSKQIRVDAVDIVHSHGYKSNFYARWAGRQRGAALVSTSHNWIDSNIKMRLYNSLDRRILRGFDALVAVSGEVAEKLIESGVDRKKVSLIANGIDVAAHRGADPAREIRARLGIDQKELVIGTVGRLAREKGHTFLFQAAEKLVATIPGLRLLIVGDGPWRAALQAEAAQRGIAERCLFTGQREDVPTLLQAMDVFVLPSLLEGRPMALLEAMAGKRAVVASAVGDVAAILRDGEAGVLVQPGDVGGIHAALARLAASSPLREGLGEAARKEVVEKYSSAMMAREYVDVYRKALRKEVREKGLVSAENIKGDQAGVRPHDEET